MILNFCFSEYCRSFVKSIRCPSKANNILVPEHIPSKVPFPLTEDFLTFYSNKCRHSILFSPETYITFTG